MNDLLDKKEPPMTVVILGETRYYATLFIDGMRIRNVKEISTKVGVGGPEVTVTVIPDIIQTDLVTPEVARRRANTLIEQDEPSMSQWADESGAANE